MAKKFVVGKSYESCDCGVAPVTVLGRSEKTVWVSNGTNGWRMRLRTDEEGNEYVTDSSVPDKWREMYTYRAEWEC